MDENQRRHIVIVDDEAVNLDLAESVLSGHYKLTKLISGHQLLKLLTRVKPDMILLDVRMPEMDGYEILRRINEEPQLRNIPVIFLTGQDDVSSERKGFQLGAKDFIKKPFDNDVMFARIRSQMELYEYRTMLEQVVEEKASRISDLQHVLTVSWAEMIESRDGTTGNHVRNTMEYYKILINAMLRYPKYEDELPERMINEIFRASALHDIGKIGISDTILKKPGPLDAGEFETMKAHSAIGAQMIGKIISKSHFDEFLNFAKDMANYHHERWDGTGYPCGLKGLEIPTYVRALSIVDVYDALTSVRPYKKAFSHHEALDIITRDCGKFFDPEIFTVFMENHEAMAAMPKDGLLIVA
ncbi:MAG: response regulator [Cloacibacillus sp.]